MRDFMQTTSGRGGEDTQSKGRPLMEEDDGLCSPQGNRLEE